MADEELCLVCCEPLEVAALGACNHRSTCAVCSIRLRQLLGDNRCILCKQGLEHVVITSNKDKKFEEYPIWGEVLRVDGKELPFDEESSAFFEHQRSLTQIKFLRSYTCQICPPPPGQGSFVAKSMKELQQHTSNRHSVAPCMLCVENRKAFPQEQEFFKRDELKYHESQGDRDGGPFKGHPLCEFCNQRMYDDNALWSHLRRSHYSCHVCEKERGITNEFFSDYEDLEAHFRNQHHICEEVECLAKKFIVFGTQIELQAHYAQSHMGSAPRSQRQVRMPVQITFARPPQTESRGGFGRGRRMERTSSPDQRGRHDPPDNLSPEPAPGAPPPRQSEEYPSLHVGRGRGSSSGAMWSGAAAGAGAGSLGVMDSEEEFPGLPKTQKGKKSKKKAAPPPPQPDPTPPGSSGSAFLDRSMRWMNQASDAAATRSTQASRLSQQQAPSFEEDPPLPSTQGPRAGRPGNPGVPGAVAPSGAPGGAQAPRISSLQDFPATLGGGGRGRGRGRGQNGAAPAPTRSQEPAAPPRVEEPRGRGPESARPQPLKNPQSTETNWAGKDPKEIFGGIRELLGESRFNDFRIASAEFKRGETEVADYYGGFSEEFGMLEAVGLFGPMVNLLPDASKRTELFELHQAYLMAAELPMGPSLSVSSRGAAPAAPASGRASAPSAATPAPAASVNGGTMAPLNGRFGNDETSNQFQDGQQTDSKKKGGKKKNKGNGGFGFEEESDTKAPTVYVESLPQFSDYEQSGGWEKRQGNTTVEDVHSAAEAFALMLATKPKRR